MNQTFHRLAIMAALLAFCVIVLGAYVRLSDAGLGCPDWPGCYGKMTWPVEHADVQIANEAFPERPVETHKAWKEMVHRYLAGALVLMVVALNWLAWRSRGPARSLRGKTTALFVLILFQAALGMWTVTLKLLPIIVMGHLLGGMATLGLLIWIIYDSRYTSGYRAGPQLRSARPLVLAALSVLIIQIALGGWTSANYAAMVCPDFPTCQGEYWPPTNFREGFTVSRDIGVDFEGGVLDLPSRTAIHLTHRIGAVITLIILLYTGFRLTRIATVQRNGILLMALVSVQFLLGVMNVVLRLPLANAVAHNGVAALLLAVLVGLVYRTSRGHS